MSILQQQASDVRIQEIDLSQVITSASSSVAAQIIVSNQGSTEPRRFTNAQSYLAEYGNPNAKISFDVYCGLDFFKEGNELWAKRVVGAGAKQSALSMYVDGLVTGLYPMTNGVADPLNPDWADAVPSPSMDPVAIFYPARGPGSFANSIGISIISNRASTPTGLAISSSASDGTLVPATYQYQIAAIDATGETLATNPAIVTIAGIGVTNTVTLTWDEVQLAHGYYIYGRTSITGSIGLLAIVGQGTTTFIDSGALTPDTTIVPKTQLSDLGEISKEFTVNVYDTAISTYAPVESFNCTLEPNTDDNGVSTELEERINPFSNYIQVASNVPALLNVPDVNASTLQKLAGGDSGTAPTSYDVANAWTTVFSNKELYAINSLINSGKASPTVQRAMDTLAQTRGDCTAFLDVPSTQQRFQDAINYRNLDLNLNSTYSGLFNPDVLESDNINGKQQYVPFSGWAAALCARTDRVANASFSIAGLNRGLVDVLKARYTFDDGEATALFKAQVNYTRTFIGQGIALWEQQTLSAKQSALSWLSVRRIVNVMKVSIYKFLLYSLQEPNDDFTGRQMVGASSQYLDQLKAARAISSYSVVSDSSNNSAAMFNSAQRTITIIIIPTLPIHQINLQVVVSKQGVSFTETLQAVGA